MYNIIIVDDDFPQHIIVRQVSQQATYCFNGYKNADHGWARAYCEYQETQY